MAYPPPPGINNLPARPPASRGGFKAAFSSAPQPAAPSYSSAPPSSTYRAPSSYGASPVTAGHHGPSFPSYPSSGVSSSTPAAAYSYPQQPSTSGYGPQSYAPQSYAPSSYAAPQIKNPFAAPGQESSTFDPEMAAQIAQWQSAYVTKDGKAAGTVDSPKPEPQQPAVQDTDKKKTVVREGGGKKWTDDTLLEWDPSHLRLFVGNLAGETTDDSLLKAFSRWKSVQKARVIRDKRTTKSKGYGFVSFSDADDFFQAAKEMNGKYIQSHPVTIRKANTEIKITNNKDKNFKKNNNKKRNENRGGYEPSLGPAAGGGVTKPGQKTKNGLRLLG